MTKTQRRRAYRKPVDSSAIHIEVADRIGGSNWIGADVVDIIDGGFGVKVPTPLRSGSTVAVRGNTAEGAAAEYLAAGV